MATLSITIPDDKLGRVRAAFGVAYGYQDTINGSPNPESLAQFTRRRVIEYIKDVVRAHEAQSAADAARIAAGVLWPGPAGVW